MNAGPIVAATLMTLMGLGIAGFWLAQLMRGRFRSGFFRIADGDRLFWPHVLAEVGVAGGLIVGAAGLLMDASWASIVALPALGALAYTSLNSLGWALADRERRPYVLPMGLGLVCATVGLALLA